MSVELSFVLPCLNESKTIATCIQKARLGAQRSNLVNYEIIVADNGSHDGSQTIAISQGAKVLNIYKRGYGAALIEGFYAASGKYILMGDTDGTYDFSEIEVFVEKLRSGHLIVMGTRLKGGIEYRAMPFLHRYIGTPFLTSLGNHLFGCGITDINCGLRAFNRETILSLKLITTGMEFASEMPIRAAIANLPITEVPIKYYRSKCYRKSHLRTWRDGLRHLWGMIYYLKSN